MLSRDQYNFLLGHKPMLKHIYDGGSSPQMPIHVFEDIWLSLGRMPHDLNCNSCRINLCKDMYMEILNYEQANVES